MTTSMSVCGKATGSGPLHLKHSFLRCTRSYSVKSGPINGKHAARGEDPETQRELFVDILKANATKRDAKQYLSRFKTTPKQTPSGPKPDLYALLEERNARHRKDQERLDRMGVNLGGLYAPARAIANTPQFAPDAVQEPLNAVPPQDEMHMALACLRSPEKIDDETLDGLARTLSQLIKLDMRILLVLDANGHDVEHPDEIRALRKLQAEQADRLCDAIDRHNPEGGRSVPNALEVADEDGLVHVTLPNLLLDPLERGMLPIVPTIAYTSAGQMKPVPLPDIMTGLTKHLTRAQSHPGRNGPIFLDRLILLDPIGGIPSKDRGDGAHVFVNLEQEFDTISRELSEYAARALSVCSPAVSALVFGHHKSNMELIRQCLELLPSSTSALIVSPEEAAISSRVSKSKVPTLGTGTRRQKNPLIHNLLTNKPLISSSLPTARLTGAENESATRNAATVLRRGMPLKIIPATHRATGWQLPANGISTLDLEQDPRVDLPRLVHLIEDSFRRKLNVHKYLGRVAGRIAGIIVAGEYEGGAVLTWEMPPGINDPSRLVPYLDKFAVLQSSQGASGVADMVFQAMVRTCFPHGVCWRSRKDNPVNKWYFERSAGSWQIPDSNWTMFWTGDGIADHRQRWEDYVSVCSSIAASWADTDSSRKG